MSNKIFKYLIPVQEKYDIQLPIGAKIIRVEDVDGLFYLWAIVDDEAQLETVHLCCYKTGGTISENINSLEYLGCCKLFVIQELALYYFKINQPKSKGFDINQCPKCYSDSVFAFTESENRCHNCYHVFGVK